MTGVQTCALPIWPRNPHAALAGAHIYHYGWVRKAEQMQAKLDQVAKYWAGSTPMKITYADFDPQAVTPFQGTHPAVMAHWIATQAEQEINFNPDYQLTPKERKYRLSMKLEKLTGLDFSRKHFKLVG